MKVLLVGVLFVQLSLIASQDHHCDEWHHDHENEYACKEGWESFEFDCYLKVDEAMPWADAEGHCNKMGANLASIHSNEENDFVKSLGTDVWLGFSDMGNEGEFEWTDDSFVDYTNWAGGEPNDWQGSGGEDCTHNYGDGRWNDIACKNPKKSVCKAPQSKVCKPGFEFYDMDCYSLVEEPKAWAAAEEDCQAKGAHLVSIHSPEENEYVLSLGKDLWLGLTDEGAEGIFSWTDGTVFEYGNWAAGEPNDWQGSGGEDCVHNYSDGHWNDIACSQKKRYVCKH